MTIDIIRPSGSVDAFVTVVPAVRVTVLPSYAYEKVSVPEVPFCAYDCVVDIIRPWASYSNVLSVLPSDDVRSTDSIVL